MQEHRQEEVDQAVEQNEHRARTSAESTSSQTGSRGVSSRPGRHKLGLRRGAHRMIGTPPSVTTIHQAVGSLGGHGVDLVFAGQGLLNRW